MDLQRLLGAAPRDDSLSIAQRLLAELGCGSVVVSMGAEGAQVAASGVEVLVPAPAVDVTDTTGAGDVLVGTLAARLAAGATLVDATAAACHAAAEAVRTTGARGYLQGARTRHAREGRHRSS